MKVAIVVPTYNGAGKLPVLLKSLALQWHENYELIIVDDGSNTPIIESLIPAIEDIIPIKVIRTLNNGRSAARNRGVAETKADLLVFCDDDMELPPGTLEKHIYFHTQNSNSILVANPAPLPTLKKGDSFSKFRFSSENRWAEALKNKALYRCSFRNYFFTTQNMSLPRRVFENLEGFDERLKDSEDFDFGVRALIHDIPVYVDGRLVVWHREIAGLDQTLRRQQQYYQWKVKLLELHPEYCNILPEHFFWLKNTLLKRAKKSIFTNALFKRTIFNPIVVSSLPDRLKFYLFSTYLYANSVP
jgi:glycosyltransferase involved in cell wall biosynthesis